MPQSRSGHEPRPRLVSSYQIHVWFEQQVEGMRAWSRPAHRISEPRHSPCRWRGRSLKVLIAIDDVVDRSGRSATATQ